MAQTPKFRNRFPNICAAGKPHRDEESVAQCLQIYSLEDKVNAIKHEANVWDKKEPFLYKQGPLENIRNCGVFTKVRNLMQQPANTRFQTLVADLKETPHASYWDWEPGKKRDSTGQLPLSIDPYTTTFGDPTIRTSTVKELVSPAKTYGQVYDEYVKGHENYKKSHNDYYPNEPINRNYLKPAFNPNRRFGSKAGYDPRGIWMKCIMAGDTQDLAVVNDIKSDYDDRFGTKLGEAKTPNKNIERVPANYRFGVKGCDITLAEVFDDNLPIQVKTDLKKYLMHINPLRNGLKKLYNRNLFCFSKFLMSLRYHDKNFTCWIPLETAYEVCDFYNVFFYKDIMTEFLYLLNIAKNGCVNYQKFVDVLNWKAKFPNIDAWHVPIESYSYETTNQAALRDYTRIDNTNMRKAGVPTKRFDIPEPTVPIGGCRADLVSLGADTDAAILISPTILCQYGLTFYDFYQPRPKETIRTIFKNIGYDFDDDMFNEIWCKALDCDQTGDVCVNTFNELVKQLPKK